jgi:hypothetical protein
MQDTVTLTPIVLTVSLRAAEDFGWIGEVHNQVERLLYSTSGLPCNCWDCVRARAATWALTYIHDRGGRAILPQRPATIRLHDAAGVAGRRP